VKLISFLNIFYNKHLPLFEYRDYIHIFIYIRSSHLKLIKKLLPQVLLIISNIRIQIIVLSSNIFTQMGPKDDTRSANLLLFRNILYLVYLELNILEIFLRILFPILPTVEERHLKPKHFHKSREGNLR